MNERRRSWFRDQLELRDVKSSRTVRESGCRPWPGRACSFEPLIVRCRPLSFTRRRRPTLKASLSS